MSPLVQRLLTVTALFLLPPSSFAMESHAVRAAHHTAFSPVLAKVRNPAPPVRAPTDRAPVRVARVHGESDHPPHLGGRSAARLKR